MSVIESIVANIWKIWKQWQFGRKPQNIIVTSVYNSPRNILTKNLLQNLLGIGNKILVAGDFNARYVTWNCRCNNRNSLSLYKFINENNVMVMSPDEAIHVFLAPTAIDLALI